MFTTAIISALLSFGSKFIEDKDKKTEYAFKVMDAMLNTKTFPWVDALVKLSYASQQIVKGLFRPLGAAAMTTFAIYSSYKGVHLDPAAQAVLLSAFPAWGVSRHKEKIQKLVNDKNTNKNNPSTQGDGSDDGWDF